MSEQTDIYRALKPIRKAERREERATERKNGLGKLRQWGIRPKWHSDTHCSIHAFGVRWDYWPTTGKWMRIAKGAPKRAKRGVDQLVSDIETARGEVKP